MATRRIPEPPEPLLPDFEPERPSDELRRRVLASIEPGSRLAGFVARMAKLFDLPEERARELLAAADQVTGPGWVDAPAPGVRLYHFKGGPRVDAADCGLVHLAAGTAFPRHRHLGVEWNLALSGCAEEDGGERWLPGDLVIRETDSVHGFRAVGDEPFLFAVVLEGGLAPAPPD
jgi:anti-sigma factor ChrR (cupin superfamily)